MGNTIDGSELSGIRNNRGGLAQPLRRNKKCYGHCERTSAWHQHSKPLKRQDWCDSVAQAPPSLRV